MESESDRNVRNLSDPSSLPVQWNAKFGNSALEELRSVVDARHWQNYDAQAANKFVLPHMSVFERKTIHTTYKAHDNSPPDALSGINNMLQDIRQLRHAMFQDQQRRSLLGNPDKLLNLSCGITLLPMYPRLASVPLTYLAAQQGYHDFTNFKEQNSLLGSTKFAAGLLSDAAIGTAALGFLHEGIPIKLKAPLLLGGILARAIVDLLPPKKDLDSFRTSKQ
jgi:hypothetical protein